MNSEQCTTTYVPTLGTTSIPAPFTQTSASRYLSTTVTGNEPRISPILQSSVFNPRQPRIRSAPPSLTEKVVTATKRWLYINVERPWNSLMKPVHCLCACPRPFRDALVILWPFPWKFSSPPLVPVQTLLDNPDYITSRKITEVNYTMLHHLTLFCLRDTPLRCLYRLYESTVTSDEEAMMEESQYWFHRQPGWRLADIPDPRDPDPIRYAILASLTDALVLSFNHKVQMGLRRGITIDKPWLIAGFSNDPNPPFEHTPTWCQSLGPLSEKLVLYPGTVICDNLEVLPGPILTSNLGPFIKRNIVANFAQLYNV